MHEADTSKSLATICHRSSHPHLLTLVRRVLPAPIKGQYRLKSLPVMNKQTHATDKFSCLVNNVLCRADVSRLSPP